MNSLSLHQLASAILMITAGALLSGCSSSHRTQYYVLNRLQPDCGNKAVQMNFLKEQLQLVDSGTTSPVKFIRSAVSGASEPTIEGRKLSDVRFEGRVKELIWELRSSCG